MTRQYGEYVIARFDFSIIREDGGSDEYVCDSYQHTMADAQAVWNNMLDVELADANVAGGVYYVGKRDRFTDEYEMGFEPLPNEDKYAIVNVTPMLPGTWPRLPNGNARIKIVELPWHFRTPSIIPASADYAFIQNFVDVYVYEHGSISLSLVQEITRYFGVDEGWMVQGERVYGLWGRESEMFDRFTVAIRDPKRGYNSLFDNGGEQDNE